MKDITYEYSTGVKALNNVNAEFPKGTISAVLGESGSGKTTLLLNLGKFLKPDKGEIFFNGINIEEITELEFRKSIGIVFQKLYLFPHLTVLQNMTLAPVKVFNANLDEVKVEAKQMLERLGIPNIEHNYPTQISGGQAQRAAIARSLMLHPEYLLLDEPTSALDINTTEEFAYWLLELKEETNFVIVTHDVLFARQVATNCIYLTEGEVIVSGSMDVIIQHINIGENYTTGEKSNV